MADIEDRSIPKALYSWREIREMPDEELDEKISVPLAHELSNAGINITLARNILNKYGMDITWRM